MCRPVNNEINSAWPSMRLLETLDVEQSVTDRRQVISNALNASTFPRAGSGKLAQTVAQGTRQAKRSSRNPSRARWPRLLRDLPNRCIVGARAPTRVFVNRWKIRVVAGGYSPSRHGIGACKTERRARCRPHAIDIGGEVAAQWRRTVWREQNGNEVPLVINASAAAHAR
jgi:hypothetical protein